MQGRPKRRDASIGAMAVANVPAGTDAAPTAGQWQWVAPPFR